MLPISLVVNGARIAGTALCLDWWGVEAATGLPHELLGQALVLITAGLLVWGASRGAAQRAARMEVSA